eukprot:3866417-Prymnesium_polylepis.1
MERLLYIIYLSRPGTSSHADPASLHPRIAAKFRSAKRLIVFSPLLHSFPSAHYYMHTTDTSDVSDTAIKTIHCIRCITTPLAAACPPAALSR